MRFLLIGVTGLPAICPIATMPSAVATCASSGVPCHDIADRVNARLAGALIAVDFHEPAVELDARAFEADVVRDRLPAHRDQQRLDFEVLLLAVRKSRARIGRPLSYF